MKRFLSIISLFFLAAAPAAAQEYDSPEYVSLGRELPRGKIVAYPTAEEAQALGAGAVASKYLRPVTGWTRTEEADAVVFTSKYVIPFMWLSRQAILYVDEASGAYEVLVNGKKVGYSSNAFAPAEFNVTKASKEDVNTGSIRILKEHWSSRMEDFAESREPRVGEVYVMSQPMIRVRDVVHNTNVDLKSEFATVEVGLVVKTESLNPKTARIHYELIAPDTTVVTHGYKDVTLGMRGEDTVKFMASIPYVLTWCADMPVRYRLNVKTQIEGRFAEYQSHMIGFRTVETDDNGDFMINGIKTELFYRDFDPLTITDKDIIAARAQIQRRAIQDGGRAAERIPHVRFAGHVRHSAGARKYEQKRPVAPSRRQPHERSRLEGRLPRPRGDDISHHAQSGVRDRLYHGRRLFERN